jgi:K+-transporting ATPase A subunit
MALTNAKATFASAANPVQIIKNTGSYGAGVNAVNSSILFSGPTVLASNRAEFGAGGAMYLRLSDVTFGFTAALRNNSVWRCGLVSAMHNDCHFSSTVLSTMYITNPSLQSAAAGKMLASCMCATSSSCYCGCCCPLERKERVSATRVG